MTDPFAIYRETYHDQTITDRQGRVFGHDQQDQDDHVEHAAVEIPEDLIEPRDHQPRPKKIT